MFRTTHQGLAFAGVLLAASTAAAQDIPNGFQNSSAQSNAEIFVYTTNNLDVSMRPVASHVCFLTMAAGSFQNMSTVAVHRSTADMQTIWRVTSGTLNLSGVASATIVDDVGENWKLGGWTDGDATSGDSAAGEAVCVPWSDFITDDGGTKKISPMFGTISPIHSSKCETGSGRGLAWGAFAPAFISGMLGSFRGPGERVYVEEGSLIQSSSFHAVNGDSVNGDCRSYFIEVVGYSLLATPIPADNSPPAVYPNYVAFHQQLQANANESHAQLLARSQDAVCYFTALGGDFRSRDERAQISLQWVGGQEFWELDTTAGAGNVEAEVSCLSYDQRHSTTGTPD